MFAPYCPRHGCQVLLTTSRIRNLSNLGEGVIALELECYDGQLLLLLTGSTLNTAGSVEPPRSARPPQAPGRPHDQVAVSRHPDVDPLRSGS